jgi:hypothetical protein
MRTVCFHEALALFRRLVLHLSAIMSHPRLH